MRPVVGFLSYATAADRDTDASISTLRDVLERAVRAHGAAGFELFQDRVSIRWGDDWERTLTGALDDALFFLPVLTPQFFASDWCRREAEAFLEGALEEAGLWERPGPVPGAAAARFGDLVGAAARPIDDVRGSAAYRRHALAVLARRALAWCREAA